MPGIPRIAPGGQLGAEAQCVRALYQLTSRAAAANPPRRAAGGGRGIRSTRRGVYTERMEWPDAHGYQTLARQRRRAAPAPIRAPTRAGGGWRRRRRRARCCARSASAMRISPSRRSASPRPGRISRPATCISMSWRARRRPAPMRRRQERGFQYHHRLGRHLDGLAGHALLAGVARGDRRLDRNGRRRRGLRRLVAIGGCDKNMPGCAMAIARLNRPAVFVYGGTIRPGQPAARYRLGVRGGRRTAAGKLSMTQLLEVERTAIPGPGSCGGMYTANTMASAIEALGLSLPGSSAQEAVGDERRRTAAAPVPLSCACCSRASGRVTS